MRRGLARRVATGGLDAQNGSVQPARLPGLAVLAALAVSCATARDRPASPTGETGPPEAPAADPARTAGADGAPRAPSPRREGPGGVAGTDGTGSTGTRPAPPGTPETVREAVREAATARGQPAYGVGPALHAIASLIERTAGGSADVVAPVERMRGELAALERLGRIDLGRADRVRAALDHGVDAARALARRLGAEGLAPWVEAAARAAAAVDPAVPLGVQRAVTQDALRALADAVLVAAQLGARGPPG